jgi:DNA-binding transcriptional MerR regulator
MPSIGDLPATPKLTIKSVCAQTGIRPVTLRAWERRYKLVTPERTRGNYRLYSERDVATLRWLKYQVDRGTPISLAAAELSAARIQNAWPEPMPPLPRTSGAPSKPPAKYARQLFAALTAMDEQRAGVILEEAQARFELTAVCLEIAQPCLIEIGEAWYRGDIRIANEHFASQYLRGWLMSRFQGYPLRRSGPRLVVGCAPHEFHDIGCLMLALFLRLEGYRVEYLGADIDLRDLLDYARAERPTLILLSANSEASARELRLVQTRLVGMRPRPTFGYGGQAFNLKPALRDTVPGVFLGEDASQALRLIHGILPV